MHVQSFPCTAFVFLLCAFSVFEAYTPPPPSFFLLLPLPPFSVQGGLTLARVLALLKHVLAALQVSRTAGDMQVEGARLGAVFNLGGSAVANDQSVLEAA